MEWSVVFVLRERETQDHRSQAKAELGLRDRDWGSPSPLLQARQRHKPKDLKKIPYVIAQMKKISKMFIEVKIQLSF